ncbi:adenosine 3'-phospho 5'-phosphosulfate transporter 2-like [Argopecten irradians]|uniref:adenosine 3'-phospho 5'-phosphosulfate transporter 2-like n=1 Tax=Argopecten irradians TaxID=31199 RepID=UPI0037220504
MSPDSLDRVMHARGSKLKVVIVDISHLSSRAQVLVLSIAMCGFFIIAGLFLELSSRIYRQEFLKYNWYLTLIQLASFSLYGMVTLKWQQTTATIRRLPLGKFTVLALLTVISFGFGNLSLSYTNFPTLVLYKSMKLVPVMATGVLFYGKPADTNQITSAILITLGVVGFTLTDAQVSTSYSHYGVMAMLLVICADIGIGSMQQRTSIDHRYSDSEMMFYSCSIGFLGLLVSLVLSRTFEPAFRFCNKHMVETYGYTIMSSVFGLLGTNVLQTLMKSHGSLVGVTVTLLRKALSIALSFIVFPKPFVYQYIWSALLFFAGFIFNIYTRQRKIVPKNINVQS